MLVFFSDITKQINDTDYRCNLQSSTLKRGHSLFTTVFSLHFYLNFNVGDILNFKLKKYLILKSF